MKSLFTIILLFFVFLPFTLFAQVYMPLTSGNVTLGTSTAALPALKAYSCTFQAWSTNTGLIYLGGFGVTRSGTTRGLTLSAGASFSNVGLINLNNIYAAADTAGDKVFYGCN